MQLIGRDLDIEFVRGFVGDAAVRVVHDGRAGGAVTMSIHALALLGFDYYLTGQWDSLAEMADEGVCLCDSRSYGLLRWPARFQQALLAAARGDSATARAITDPARGRRLVHRAGRRLTPISRGRAA